jgi:SAM-dependent methyltransferase
MNLKNELQNVIKLFKLKISRRYLTVNLDRILHDIENFKKIYSDEDFKKLEVLDVGGGLGLFSIGLKILNVKRSVIVDDFSELFNNNKEVKNIFKKYNVDFIKTNLLSNKITRIKRKYDIITCFHTIEHFHNSPKNLLAHLSKILKKNGLFILCSPNSNNIKKRLECLFGFYSWSNLEDYFDKDLFRGHVREPNLSDLVFFVKKMKLKIIKIYGRNFQGLSSENKNMRFISYIFDFTLRFFPTLCSDIYIVGKK